jgi:hypothetical protein
VRSMTTRATSSRMGRPQRHRRRRQEDADPNRHRSP